MAPPEHLAILEQWVEADDFGLYGRLVFPQLFPHQKPTR